MTSYGGFIAGSDEETGFAIETDLVGTIKIVSNDRSGCGERLRQRSREGFAMR